MFHYVHSSHIYNNQKLEITQMWYIYTMEYYSAIKNNDFMKVLGKWMELENIILREVTKSQKKTHSTYSLISGY